MWEGRVLAPGFQAVHAALTAIQKGKTLSNVLWESVNFTGDVDTVAAISVAAASCHPDIPNNLHPDLYKGLEDGSYGITFLDELDAKLDTSFTNPKLLEEQPPMEDFVEGIDYDILPDEINWSEDDQGVLSMFDED